MSFVYRSISVFLLAASLFTAGIPAVRAAETGTIPNDPYWARQWYLRQIHAPEAWTMATGTKKVVVAILDGGVDITHPDLRANAWENPREIANDRIDNDADGFIDDIHGWNFITNTNDVRPVVAAGTQSEESWSHGTFVASLVGAVGNNGVGISGVNWNVQLMPLVVLDGDGFGNMPTVIRAMRYAIQKHVDVINLSLSGSEYSEELERVIKEAHDIGIFVVAATGNDGNEEGVNTDERPVYPVCMDGGVNAVFGVGGTDTLDQKAPYANFGRLCTDLVAPAQEFFGARPSYLRPSDRATTTANYLDGMTGTSLAAPLVAGAAALLKSVRPDLTAAQLGDVLRYSADPIEDNLTISQRGRMGAGRLNVARALSRIAPSSLLVAQTPYRMTRSPGLVVFSAQIEGSARLWTEVGDVRFASWTTSTELEADVLIASPSTWTQKSWDPMKNQVRSTPLWRATSKVLAPVQAATSSLFLTFVPASTTALLVNVETGVKTPILFPKALGRTITQALWWPERQAWIVWSAERRGILIDAKGVIIADLDLTTKAKGLKEQVLIAKDKIALQLTDSRRRTQTIRIRARAAVKSL